MALIAFISGHTSATPSLAYGSPRLGPGKSPQFRCRWPPNPEVGADDDTVCNMTISPAFASEFDNHSGL